MALATGCNTPPRSAEVRLDQEALKLLMPSRIEIVEPFTQVMNLEGGGLPDCIEVSLQATNSLDNPGLMIAGRLGVELFEQLSGGVEYPEQAPVATRSGRAQEIEGVGEVALAARVRPNEYREGLAFD